MNNQLHPYKGRPLRTVYLITTVLATTLALFHVYAVTYKEAAVYFLIYLILAI
jgi:hypothetical protein